MMARTPVQLPAEMHAHAMILRALAAGPVTADFAAWAQLWETSEDRSFESATAMHAACAQALELAKAMEAAALEACRAAAQRKRVTGR